MCDNDNANSIVNVEGGTANGEGGEDIVFIH